MRQGIGRSTALAKNLLILFPTTKRNPPNSRLSHQIFILLHLITKYQIPCFHQMKTAFLYLFSCCHWYSTIFILTLNFLHSKVMLILILFNVYRMLFLALKKIRIVKSISRQIPTTQ